MSTLPACGAWPLEPPATSLRIQGIGHWNLVEQSERPEPPWLTMYEQLDETRDLRRGRLRQRSEGRGAILDSWQSFTLILADDEVKEVSTRDTLRCAEWRVRFPPLPSSATH